MNIENFRDAVEQVGLAIEAGGVLIMVLGILIAADVIFTVAVTPTIESVLILGLNVRIRTFLSFALQMEVEGRIPWQSNPAASKPTQLE